MSDSYFFTIYFNVNSNLLTLFSLLQEKLMGHLGVVLYEYLGEEYPEVLGSILGALKAIVNVIGMEFADHVRIFLFWFLTFFYLFFK